jgi:SH3-like domain-containing protein
MAGLRLAFALLLALIAALGPAAALRAADNPSGLPLPRFATTRSTPINVRVGPGTRYDIAWVYVKAGTPVEIVQEFDTWRKIRDVDGSEGWVHQNLLSGKRAGIAAPWRADAQVPLRSGRSATDGIRAYLGSGLRVEIGGCDGSWCEVVASAEAEGGARASFSGFLQQSDLWGVYEGETFN